MVMPAKSPRTFFIVPVLPGFRGRRGLALAMAVCVDGDPPYSRGRSRLRSPIAPWWLVRPERRIIGTRDRLPAMERAEQMVVSSIGVRATMVAGVLAWAV